MNKKITLNSEKKLQDEESKEENLEAREHCGFSESGSVTVVMIGLIMVALLSLIGVAGVTGSGAGNAQAGAAADLSALTGAQALQSGQNACVKASEVAQLNRSKVIECQIIGQSIQVTVEHKTRVALWFGSVKSTARAGPSYMLQIFSE